MILGNDIKDEMLSKLKSDIILPVQLREEIKTGLDEGFFSMLKALKVLINRKLNNIPPK